MTRVPPPRPTPRTPNPAAHAVAHELATQAPVPTTTDTRVARTEADVATLRAELAAMRAELAALGGRVTDQRAELLAQLDDIARRIESALSAVKHSNEARETTLGEVAAEMHVIKHYMKNEAQRRVLYDQLAADERVDMRRRVSWVQVAKGTVACIGIVGLMTLAVKLAEMLK